MYQDFYGLRELPFELTPNTNFLFLSAHQREVLSNLQYGLLAAKSLTLVTGEAGTGKTTLIHAALESERCRAVRCVYLNNPVLSPEDFVRTLAMRFELGSEAAGSKAVLLQELEETLQRRNARGEITALVVDEAHALSVELLEEIRLLANIETATTKLLPLVLAGQPELGERLEESALRQLKQRVTLRCELTPFTLSDTAAYIGARIARAGGIPARLFTQEAVTLIHESSAGIPRTVNVICDNALVTAMAAGRAPVDRAIVADVCRDFRLKRESNGEPPHGAERLIEQAAVEAPHNEETLPLPSAGDNGGAATDVTHTRRRSWLRLRTSAATLRESNRIITE